MLMGRPEFLQRDPSVLNGDNNGLGSVIHFHFLQDAAYMIFHCFFAYVKNLADCLIAFTFRHETQHFRFPAG